MKRAVDKVCVVGSGVMGAALAAQIANSGTHVLLLDMAGAESSRNVMAQAAIAKLLKSKPAPLMSTAYAKLIEPGNVEDDLHRVAECGWILEVIVEDLAVKQALYRRIDAFRRPGTPISSNTSTISLFRLVEGQDEDFTRSFAITHFFNPPRYMPLMELVVSGRTAAAVVNTLSDFCTRCMGKTIVRSNDTPGFIANRIGTYWLQFAIAKAIELGLTVEEADAIAGKPLGLPKTGVFGLMDLIGLDLSPKVLCSFEAALPPGDVFHKVSKLLPIVAGMIDKGRIGRKGGGGFYRRAREQGRAPEVLDLATGEYRETAPPDFLDDIAMLSVPVLIDQPGRAGTFAWELVSEAIAYSASLLPEVTDDITAIDQAMTLGYGWRYGPFALLDMIGVDRFIARREREGRYVPPLLHAAQGRRFHVGDGSAARSLGLNGAYRAIATPKGCPALSAVRQGEPLLINAGAALWDIGDGVTCLELRGKRGSIDLDVVNLILQAIPMIRDRYRALILYTDGPHFSAGVNLHAAVARAGTAQAEDDDPLLETGQSAFKALKYAQFPVVAAVGGSALGGGCELMLHADTVQCHAESVIGLVECSVGLIPGWGGCGELLDRWIKSPALAKGPMPAIERTFEIVSMATTSTSAAHARELGFLRPDDGITMNRDFLLVDAKHRALAMVEGYAPPSPPEFVLPGRSAFLQLEQRISALAEMGRATDYDAVVWRELAWVLCGGESADLSRPVSESEMLMRERRGLNARSADIRTRARLEHMLATGTPLRN